MNIYEIEQELLDIFDELEENGGELTEELEQKLTITQEEFKDKIENYTNVIKLLDNDMMSIKNEQARLKALYDKKEKVASKLKDIIINAVKQFGDTKKTGVKYLNYGTGEVSIRRTQAVGVNEDLVKEVEIKLSNIITYAKSINLLDCYDRIGVLDLVSDYNNDFNTEVSEDELSNINIDLSVKVSLKDLATGEGYNVLKEIAKYSDVYKLSADVSKTNIKNKLKENGACMPNLAKLNINESLTIK